MRLQAVHQVLLPRQLPNDRQLGLDRLAVVRLMQIDDLGDEGLAGVVLVVGHKDLAEAALPQFFVLGDEIGGALEFFDPDSLFVLH